MANNPVAKTGNLPALPNRAEVLARAAEVHPVDIDGLHADLQSLARPATRLDIGQHLVILLGCFPNAKTEDTEIFGRALADYVAEANPSLSDLEAARHRLIKTMSFRPSIAEVLEALEAEKQRRLRYADRIAYIVKDCQEAAERERLAAERQRFKALKAEGQASPAKSRDDDEDINF